MDIAFTAQYLYSGSIMRDQYDWNWQLYQDYYYLDTNLTVYSFRNFPAINAEVVFSKK